MRTMRTRLAGVLALASIFTLVVPSSSTANVFGTDVTYTTDADFDLGTLVSVNHDDPFNDQLQLNSPTEPFPFINVAASGRGTVVRVNTDTGAIVGEYRTAPEGLGLNPSRTTVDLFGNVWTANRGEEGEIDGVPHGSAVKIGLVVGGTRVDVAGTPDGFGEYLAPPFGYSTCVDRDGDGLLRTSSGLLDTLDWPDLGDGLGGPDGVVEDAVDECILLYQRLPEAEQARHVSVDADNNVWVGGFPFDQRMFHRLDGTTGAIIDSFDARDFGCGGYGGLIDGNGVLWSIGWGSGDGPLLRYDPTTRIGTCVNTFGGYGLGIDTNGFLWASLWENSIAKVSPDGVLEPGFPKSTWLPPAPAPSPAGFRSVRPTSFEPIRVADLSVASMPAPAKMLATFLALAAPDEAPDFWAAPDDNWVSSMNAWPLGSTVSLLIADGSGVVYSDSQTVDPDGNFNFNLGGIFDLQRGHIVTVTDGTTTKTHVVLDLFVDGINVDADTVSGRAAPGASVDVWVHDTGANITATVDGSGNWTADFSSQADLTYISNGNSQQLDADGDATSVFWASPRFSVSPDHDWVGSMTRWTPGSTVSMTIEDGSGVVHSDSQTVDASGNFNYDLNGVVDVERGQVVTVSDGTTTKTHQVIELFVDAVDIDADTVSGRGIVGTPVDVWVHGDGNVTVMPDGSGQWTADFSGLTDLTYGVNGDSQQIDDEGDGTTAPWSVRNPKIIVYRDQGFMRGHEFEPGVPVSIAIGGLEVGSVVTDEGGEFWFDHPFDIDQTVTAVDGTTLKTHVVTGHTIGVVDHVANTASGTAEPLSWVTVEIEGSPVNIHRGVQADAGGVWFTDFDVPDVSGQTDDITPFTTLYVWQTDDDGDNTTVSWQLSRFSVDVDYDGIAGNSWERGVDVAISLDGTPLGSTSTDQYGGFSFDAGIDLTPGQSVTVVGPENTKNLLISGVQIIDVNAVLDTISGVATPGAELEVSVQEFDRPVARKAVADGVGNWTVDFSVPAADPTNDDWENQAWDITIHTRGWVNEWDDDGDATVRNFGPPVQQNRGVAVTPIDNHVWVANSGVGTVTRLDNDGNILAVIATGNQPTGVAVDAVGKVWVTNLGSDNTVRIDPTAGPDGLGAVDLTVDLGEGASPYNYSDMTGAVVVGSTSPQGFWTVVQDSGEPGFEWGRITWNTEPGASEPAGSAIVVEARTADTAAGLGAEAFVDVINGELFSSFGRFIEVRVTLKASSDNLSPVLSDIRVQPAVIEVGIDIKPGSYPNTIKAKRVTGVVPVAVLGSEDFDVMTIDVTTLRFGPDLALPAHDLTAIGGHYEDVDLDGFLDLVSHYVAGDIGLVIGDTEACLIGTTLGGIPIEGCDSVRMR